MPAEQSVETRENKIVIINKKNFFFHKKTNS